MRHNRLTKKDLEQAACDLLQNVRCRTWALVLLDELEQERRRNTELHNEILRYDAPVVPVFEQADACN